MRKPSLTHQSRILDGQLVSEYVWHGHHVDVRDSARNALLVIELFSDEQLTPQEKAELLVCMLFPNLPQIAKLAEADISSLMVDVVWDAFGLDISEDQRHATEYETPIFDWEEDAARIRASLLQSYGIDWNTVASSMSYVDICTLLGSLLEADSETPFQQAIYYRTAKPPQPTKNNKDICRAFNAKARHFALGQHKSNAEAQNDRMADMFTAAKRAAKEA